MIRGQRICEEFVPIIWADIGLSADIETLDNGSEAIFTVCEYKHLSELALRMFSEGFLIGEIEGNITAVVDDDVLTKDHHRSPTLCVSFMPMNLGSNDYKN